MVELLKLIILVFPRFKRKVVGVSLRVLDTKLHWMIGVKVADQERLYKFNLD